MNNMSKEKLKTLTIIILAFGLLFFGVKLIEDYWDEQKEYESFIHEFFTQLKYTSNSVEYVLSNADENRELGEGLKQVRQRLETLETLSSTGHSYVIRDIPTISFDERFYIETNGILTKQQLSDLQKLNEALNYMIGELNSNELDEVYKDVSIEELNRIIIHGEDLMFKE